MASEAVGRFRREVRAEERAIRVLPLDGSLASHQPLRHVRGITRDLTHVHLRPVHSHDGVADADLIDEPVQDTHR